MISQNKTAHIAASLTQSIPKLLTFLIIIIALSVAYSNSFTNQFVYDDRSFIELNSSIKDLNNWPHYFTDVSTQSGYHDFFHYRPLVTLSFALNYALGGLNPPVYHITNFGFHLLNVILVLWLVRLLTEDDFIALAVAMLWGLHPVLTEAVSWIAGRANLMSATFFLIALISYLHWQRPNSNRWWLAAVVLSYIVSLLCKEMAITLPLLLIFLDCMDEQPRIKLRQYLLVYILLFALALIFWSIRFWVIGHLAMPGTWSNNPFVILSTMSRVMGQYFSLLLWPTELHLAYQFPQTASLMRLDVLLNLTIILAGVFSTFYFRKRRFIISLGSGWFLINILPVSNIIPFQVVIAERFLYLPSIGFALLLGYAVSRFEVRSKNLAYAVLILICLLYARRTFSQNRVWENESSLFRQTIKYEPNNEKAHFALGTYFMLSEQYSQAEKALKKTIQLNPRNFEALNNLGITYKNRMKYERAESCFKQALSIKGNYYEALYNLAKVYGALKDSKQQAEALEKLISLTPKNPDLYFELSMANLKLGEIEKARYYCEKMVSLEPKHPYGQYLKEKCGLMP